MTAKGTEEGIPGARSAFLKTIPPFAHLNDHTLQMLSENMGEMSFTKGTLILRAGRTQIEALYLIRSGGVKLCLRNEDRSEVLKEYRGAGDYFGALGIIMNRPANLNVEAVEDTTCFLIPKKVFGDLLEANPQVSFYFLRSICERYIHSAHFELRKREEQPRGDSALYLFGQDIGGIMKGAPLTCLAEDSVQKAAKQMADFRIGSLLVKDDKGSVTGIITDKDIRTKLVAKGLDSKAPVKSIMTAPVKTASSQTICFDALCSMLKNRIHHLAVTKGDDIVGIVTAHDMLLLQGDSPIYLFREIAAQTDFKGLYSVPRRFPGLASRLMAEGARAGNITRMITVLNDHLLDRILSLLIEEMGAPPVPFCWIVMGSEGRKEQTFSTDQDNALIYEEPSSPGQEDRVREYFLGFAARAVHHLAECGFASCRGDIMASNPKWTRSLTEWKKLFDHWIFSPDPKEVLHSTIFFDFRAAFGKSELASELRQHLVKRGLREKVFIHHLARDCLATRPPLTLFKNFVVEKEGPYKGLLDLKTKGMTPFVDCARLLSLHHGITETNTVERIQALRELGFISDDFFSKVKTSYEFQMQLRLAHQLDLIKQGASADNYINPARLSDIEQHTLKKAFAVVGEIQSFLTERFHLNLG